MMKYSLTDLHCDTPYEIFKRRLSFNNSLLAISLENTLCYEKYIQVAAIWSDNALDNTAAYKRFFEIADYFRKDISKQEDSVLYNSDVDTEKARRLFILSVEDARILDGDLCRLDALHHAGARLLTLLWRGETCIGGAFDTDVGLTEFGKETVKKCISLKMIPDISHASQKSAFDVFDITEGACPVIASHSA